MTSNTNDKPESNFTIFEIFNNNVINKLLFDSNFEEEFIDGNIESTWDDEIFMTKLVKSNGLLLGGASDRIKKNEEICFLAIENNIAAKKYIDKSIISIVMNRHIENLKYNIQQTKMRTGFIRDEVYVVDLNNISSERPIKRIRTFEKNLNNLQGLA